jgi:uncharacterized protein YaaQ
MKLMIVIIRDLDEERVVHDLVQNGYRVTRMASTGGFLRRGNITLLIGVEEDRVEGVFQALRQACCPEDSQQHRATVFTLDTPYFERI